jgi:hypothetical protein
MSAATETAASRNGTEPASPIAEAMRTEAEIREKALETRKGSEHLTEGLLDKLQPLLEEKIPAGFIQHVPATTGKPYDSDGIKSVQVQVDRMNAVLGITGWRASRTYHDEGKLCHVVVQILGEGDTVLAEREGWGGVNRGSTVGNLYKGSYTNAAKLAFAQLGPGHEVYLGATDFDPDTDRVAAEEQAKGQPRRAADEQPSADVDLATDPAAALDDLLAADHPLKGKRTACVAAMKAAGAGPAQQLRELRAVAENEKALDDLTKRAENAKA